MLVLGSAINAKLLLALLPLALIDLGIVIYCIVDLYKPDRRVRGGNKTVWLLVILLISTLGWVAYLLAGRED
ncbi:MAG: PLD nuclease N-terminal domain-containing protein [Ktedonobacterales bacterium]